MVVTYNGSSWKTLKDFLVGTTAPVVLAQEVRVLEPQIDAASSWAKRYGWKSLFSAACPASARGPASGGVAIFVRDSIGLMRIPEHPGPLVPARLLAGIYEAPGYGQVLLGPGWLITGEGASQDNLDIISKFCALAQICGMPWILAADFQATPHEIAATGICDQARARLVHATTELGTCRNATGGWRTIDYFLVQTSLAYGIQGIRIMSEVPPIPMFRWL